VAIIGRVFFTRATVLIFGDEVSSATLQLGSVVSNDARLQVTTPVSIIESGVAAHFARVLVIEEFSTTA